MFQTKVAAKVRRALCPLTVVLHVRVLEFVKWNPAHAPDLWLSTLVAVLGSVLPALGREGQWTSCYLRQFALHFVIFPSTKQCESFFLSHARRH